LALRSGIVLGVVFLVLQLVPAGRSHTNPPVTADAPWPSEAARSLAVDACYDCHSNETDWPLYSYVAPASWLVTRDVEAGRERLNFSQWDDDPDAGDAAEAVADRSMPPGQYTLLHPDARLSAAERDLLVASLTAMDEAEDDEGGQGRGRGRGRGGD
jgi:hypothetical protein